MTIKEAILKVLTENKGAYGYKQIYQFIDKNNYVDWKGKTPADTVSALLGEFIRKNDSRVKRIKNNEGFYVYYLAKYEGDLLLNNFPTENTVTKNTYKERDLHILLSTYLQQNNTFAKTIFHEKSNGKDEHQKWVHPDMVGITLTRLKNKTSNALMKAVNKSDAFDIVSYELKREIITDYELKKCYFQAVSNSSWANYGYLVAFEIGKNLNEELERLHQSFGIGVIELQANPYESEVLFPARHKPLDFKTIDKLCEINYDFKNFINHTEKLLTAGDKYITAVEKEFIGFCDKILQTDTEIEEYCLKNNIVEKQVM